MRCKKKLSERSHSHRRTRGGDLLLCFTSRRSASATAAASSSAAAMRVPSTKSLPSPGRSRDAAAAAADPSLSSSLSRRLRNSGSVKGGQSPMFPAVVGGRRKGVAFEAAEPTSPKVTCIGQVRVKSKKKKAAAAAAAKSNASVMRSRSVRGSGREASFRRVEDFGSGRECLPSRNNKWVHQLPVSICEALRACGSEFNCFSPCGGRSSCFSSSSSRSVEGKGECREKRSGSCGAGFARRLMAVPDGEAGKRPGAVGVVVEDKRDREMGMVINQRLKKEDFDLGIDMEKGEEVVMVVEKGEEKEEDEARVSVCIPPRNALLLMRCRSDPVRMAALTSRFWDSPAMKVRVEEGREEEEQDNRNVSINRCAESNINVEVEHRSKEAAAETKQLHREEEAAEESVDASVLTEELMTASDGLEKKEEEVLLISGEEMQDEEENINEMASAPVNENAHAGDEQEVEESAAAEAGIAHRCGEKPEEKEMRDEVVDIQDGEDEKEADKGRRSSSYASTVDKQERAHRYSSRSKEGGRRRSLSSRERDRRHSFSTERDARRPSIVSEKEIRRASFSMEGKGRWSFSIEKDGMRLEKDAAEVHKRRKEPGSPEVKELRDIIEVQNSQSTEKGGGREEDDYNAEDCQVQSEAAQMRAEEKKSTELPDCLLLMMYEPKLSMEVSKETWVCSTDFLQWHLHNPNRPHHPPKSSDIATITTTTTDTGISGTSLDEVAGDEASEITNDMGSENKEVDAPIQETSQPSPPAPPTASDTEQMIKNNAAVLPTPVSASAYMPFELTRCKSEPMRSSVRLTPDACFWKDRHRPIGATRIGF